MPTQEQLRELRRENQRWPRAMTIVPREAWPPGATLALLSASCQALGVWRSRTHLAIVYPAPEPAWRRITVQRTDWDERGALDGISWDYLQQIKIEVGLGGYVAVEVYPEDDQLVNVANMRHLWILRRDARPPYAWEAPR